MKSIIHLAFLFCAFVPSFSKAEMTKVTDLDKSIDLVEKVESLMPVVTPSNCFFDTHGGAMGVNIFSKSYSDLETATRAWLNHETQMIENGTYGYYGVYQDLAKNQIGMTTDAPGESGWNQAKHRVLIQFNSEMNKIIQVEFRADAETGECPVR